MMPVRLKRYGVALMLIISVSAVAESVYRLGWLEIEEAVWYDIWHQIAGTRKSPRHAAIAAIDDYSLLKHPDEPLVFWSPHFAKAIGVLRKVGVSAVGIDFLFSISAESWFNRFNMAENTLSRTYDIPMREQLSLGKVVLIGILTKGVSEESQLILPVNEYLFALENNYADIGLANLYMDNDDVVRRFIPQILKQSRISGLTLGSLLAERAKNISFENNELPRMIGFSGPPGTIPRISFQQLLEPDAESNPDIKALKDKVVIIGLENSGVSDIHLTPYTRNFFLRSKRMMSGPEIHANIVETLLSGQYPRHVSQWLRILWLIGFAIGGAIISFRKSPLPCLGCFLILAILSIAVSYEAFLYHRILPCANVHLALILMYIGATGTRLDREQRIRRRLQQILEPYVSEAVAKQVIASEKLPDLGGETLKVTVLFSDIRNFTTISEQLSPAEVVEMLNHYYTLACEPIFKGGGMVDKFIGDAIMAVFGAPLPYPDQTRQAIFAALAIADIAGEFRKWLKARFPDRNLPEFHIGVGLHTGEAVIGNIGSAKRMAYTAIGDTVNIASRLESMSKKLGWTIVASRITADAAGSDISIGRSEKVIPSGRTGEIEVVEIQCKV
ncbi:MAG: adenylate/guanylate cyclase domain-containing protein [Desulfobacteraceae bacterium]|nr:adenylate/guanylate cyclase domain-containing protein [Desulfobacteraceae bacterium]